MNATKDGGLRVNVLGPLEIWQGTTPVALSANRLRTMVALLAMSAGETISVERLAHALWGDYPPFNPRRSVQTYIARLRHELGRQAIYSLPGGYRLEIEFDHVDALRFRHLLAEAALSRGTGRERECLQEALALWRGVPFDGVESETLRGPEAARLTELRLTAVERWIDVSLIQGLHGELVAEVQELAWHHPLREPLWQRLLVILDRCGRKAEALAMYEQLRHRLAERLGADPSPELQRIHSDLLAGDAWPSGATVPRQLPASGADFVGRGEALKEIDRLLGEGGRICVITGMVGVGKTSLALRWAQEAAPRFPDGQLYADLQGFGPADVPVDPADVLETFLEALGVARHRTPDNEQARAALYRTMLADKRMLVVLDNARDAEQVRPLVPGGADSAVVIISRRRLNSLVVTEGAGLVVLDALTRAEAGELLAGRLGQQRTETEAQATDGLIDLCERLPPALAVAAARMAANPSLLLGAQVAELRRSGAGLGVSTTRDDLTGMRIALTHSYRLLSADAAHLFRLLALHPGPDITGPAIAAMAGLGRSRSDRVLDILRDAHLVHEPSPGRFALHELLRMYALEPAETTDGWTVREARRRLIQYYAHTAHAAARLLDGAAHLPPPPAAPDAQPQRLTNLAQATDWLRAEHATTRAVLLQAGDFPAEAVPLAAAMALWCDRQGAWREQIRIQRFALTLATSTGDVAAQAAARQSIAAASIELGLPEQARAELDQALELSRAGGDPVVHGLCLLDEALLAMRQQGPAAGLRHAERCLDWFRETQRDAHQARTLNLISRCHGELGQYAQALTTGETAMGIAIRTADRTGQAWSSATLGVIRHAMAQHHRAIVWFEHALMLLRDLGHRVWEGEVLRQLGDTYQAAGQPLEAGRCRRGAEEILDEIRRHDDSAAHPPLISPFAVG
ncbi:BTAD domain-containing putative transcriptional regulator [Nonomuraea angiospora]|uniref:AfsR/SARP family transcriptional regulator n=1 Tax=Nonomuraea angiospora TaxID=46172 RepID=UPI0037B1B899